MNKLGWSAAMVAATVAVATAAPAQAQTVTVQGQVQYQPYGQPQGQAQPPPGYGQPQPYAQPYQQPYAQPYAPTYQPQQRQVRYEERTSTIHGLWIPGIIIFGVSWGLTASFGQFGWQPDYRSWTIVPLIGPWIALGSTTSDDEVTGAVVGGLAQAAGLTMFILGLSLQRTVRVAVYSFDDDDERSPQLALDALPTPGGAQVGLTFTHF